MRVFVIRHGETEFNAKRLIQGTLDSRLSGLGERQVGLLVEELKPFDIDFVFSSPAARAYYTAKPIAAQRGLPVAIVPALREREYGIYEGKPLDSTKASHPEYFATGSARLDFDVKPRGGESLKEVAGRVVPFIERLKLHIGNKTIAIVAHGIVNKLIICELLACDLGNISSYKQPNACISEILFENGKGEAVRLGATEHLKSLEDEG